MLRLSLSHGKRRLWEMGGGTQQTWISLGESAHGKEKERGWQDFKTPVAKKEKKGGSENMSFERKSEKLKLGHQKCFLKKVRASRQSLFFYIWRFLWNLKIEIYRTIILPVVLYGYEIWSLTLREEHRLRVFENRVLRRIFGPKRDWVTGEWRKLHNEELNSLYSSPKIMRVIK